MVSIKLFITVSMMIGNMIDYAIRPWAGIEQGLVLPRGLILVAHPGQERDPLLESILDKKIKISTSRCGDFHQAIPAMETLLTLGIDLTNIITDRRPVSDLPAAFDRARSADSLKVVVDH